MVLEPFLCNIIMLQLYTMSEKLCIYTHTHRNTIIKRQYKYTKQYSPLTYFEYMHVFEDIWKKMIYLEADFSFISIWKRCLNLELSEFPNVIFMDVCL